MKLGETVTYPSLEESPCVEAPLYSLCGFDGSAGSEMTMGHVFIWSVMAAVPFVGGGGRDEGSRAKAKKNLDFSYAQRPSLP